MDDANNDDVSVSAIADALISSPRVLCLVGAGLSAPSSYLAWDQRVMEQHQFERACLTQEV
jgi:hypothetical protein